MADGTKTAGRCGTMARMAAFLASVLLIPAAPGAGGVASAGEEGPAHDIPALWFPVGEALKFDLRWGYIPIGETSVQTDWVSTGRGRRIRILYRTKTNRLFDHLYPMNDRAEVLIDPAGFRSDRFSFSRTRRKTTCDDLVVFDYSNNVARCVSRCTGKTSEWEIDAETRDIMSFLYMRRNGEFAPGVATNRVITNTGHLDLRIGVEGKEDVRLAGFGDVLCWKVVPEADWDGLLIEGGRVSGWVSDDRRKVVVRIRVKAAVADVSATLSEVIGPGDDRWSRRGGD